MTDEGLKYLSNMHQLYFLGMDGLDITDVGLARIKHLPVQRLGLNGTGVTDTGVIDYLQGRYMEYISLSRTAVTDAIIPALIGLSGVERIDIQGTGISEQGYQQLVSARPGVTVYYH